MWMEDGAEREYAVGTAGKGVFKARRRDAPPDRPASGAGGKGRLTSTDIDTSRAQRLHVSACILALLITTI
jgi:hypothetical protein